MFCELFLVNCWQADTPYFRKYTIESEFTESMRDCQIYCQNTMGCTMFFRKSNGVCELKYGVDQSNIENRYLSGRRLCEDRSSKMNIKITQENFVSWS